MGSTRRAVSLAVAVATATPVVALPTAAEARYTATDGAALGISSDTLAAPSNAVLASKCRGASGNSALTVTWTPSIDTYATGYVVVFTALNGTKTSTTVAGGSSSTTTVPVPANGVTYTATVMTTYRQWTSTATAAAGTALC